MGVFSEMIRGMITEELNKMAAEAKGEETPATPEETPAAPKQEAPKPEETKPEEPKPAEDTPNNADLSDMLRKEIRAYMAQNLNGEETEQEMPTADEALKNILGFADK